MMASEPPKFTEKQKKQQEICFLEGKKLLTSMKEDLQKLRKDALELKNEVEGYTDLSWQHQSILEEMFLSVGRGFRMAGHNVEVKAVGEEGNPYQNHQPDKLMHRAKNVMSAALESKMDKIKYNRFIAVYKDGSGQVSATKFYHYNDFENFKAHIAQILHQREVEDPNSSPSGKRSKIGKRVPKRTHNDCPYWRTEKDDRKFPRASQKTDPTVTRGREKPKEKRSSPTSGRHSLASPNLAQAEVQMESHARDHGAAPSTANESPYFEHHGRRYRRRGAR